MTVSFEYTNSTAQVSPSGLTPEARARVGSVYEHASFLIDECVKGNLKYVDEIRCGDRSWYRLWQNPSRKVSRVWGAPLIIIFSIPNRQSKTKFHARITKNNFVLQLSGDPNHLAEAYRYVRKCFPPELKNHYPGVISAFSHTILLNGTLKTGERRCNRMVANDIAREFDLSLAENGRDVYTHADSETIVSYVKIQDPKCTLMVWKSGNINLSAKSQAAVDFVVPKLKNVFMRYEKQENDKIEAMMKEEVVKNTNVVVLAPKQEDSFIGVSDQDLLELEFCE